VHAGASKKAGRIVVLIDGCRVRLLMQLRLRLPALDLWSGTQSKHPAEVLLLGMLLGSGGCRARPPPRARCQ
jgi:hypothetical protein